MQRDDDRNTQTNDVIEPPELVTTAEQDQIKIELVGQPGGAQRIVLVGHFKENGLASVDDLLQRDQGVSADRRLVALRIRLPDSPAGGMPMGVVERLSQEGDRPHERAGITAATIEPGRHHRLSVVRQGVLVFVGERDDHAAAAQYTLTGVNGGDRETERPHLLAHTL